MPQGFYPLKSPAFERESPLHNPNIHNPHADRGLGGDFSTRYGEGGSHMLKDTLTSKKTVSRNGQTKTTLARVSMATPNWWMNDIMATGRWERVWNWFGGAERRRTRAGTFFSVSLPFLFCSPFPLVLDEIAGRTCSSLFTSVFGVLVHVLL